MSYLASEWASESAPAADTYERIILMKLASHASDDGRAAWPSIPSLARAALCDPETVKRRLRSLLARKVIAYGDQRLVSHFKADKRPKVYDLLIPYDWYSDDQRTKVNRQCAEVGREPLTPANRPALAPAPERRRRADLGVPNPKRSPKKKAAPESGALQEPPANEGSTHRGGSTRAPGGGSTRVAAGALQEPQISQLGTSPKKTSQSGGGPPASGGSSKPSACLPASSVQGIEGPGADLLWSLRLPVPMTEQVVRQCHERVSMLLETWDPEVLAKHLETQSTGGSVRSHHAVLTSLVRKTHPLADVVSARRKADPEAKVASLVERGYEGAREAARLLGMGDWEEPDRGDQPPKVYLLETRPAAAREFITEHREQLLAVLAR